MLRPVDETTFKLPEHFYLTEPAPRDRDEIIRAVYEAHSSGYPAAFNQPDMSPLRKLRLSEKKSRCFNAFFGAYSEFPKRFDSPLRKLHLSEKKSRCFNAFFGAYSEFPKRFDEITAAINRRFDLFGKTNTLHFGTLARHADSGELAGVCIAGIYPDSPNSFATIHQVSVRPMFRRLGIAEAMMLSTVGKAYPASPVITLGVTAGNPAELLYEKVGFRKGPGYARLRLGTP